MKGRYPNLRSDKEAIELAIQRGITSKRDNQGWGLFGSQAIVLAARGSLTIWSGSSRLIIKNGTRNYENAPFFQGTIIEWALPLNAEIHLARVLENPNRAGSFKLESYEPILGTITLKLSLEAKSFRDRPSGKKLRYKLLNLIRNSDAKHCIIDFSDVGTITSSFADEFLGKTALLYRENFKNFVGLTNITDGNKAIVEIAIQERLQSEQEAPGPQFIRFRKQM